MPGILYLCGTPIGNLEDISLRALRTLREVDLIAAEDTRRTSRLTQHYQIATPVTSYHQHNERTRGPELISQLQAGKSVALVTDAGLPGISDPGQILVQLALGAGLTVVPIPGPTAALTALVASGAPGDRFVFEGFLPRRGRARKARLAEMVAERRTVILYEAPHRLLQTLGDLAQALPERPITVARELTKHFEEFLPGVASELLAHFRLNAPRGEFTLVLHSTAPTDPDRGKRGISEALAEHLEEVERLRRGGASLKDAVQEVSTRTGLPRRQLYQAAARAAGVNETGGAPDECPRG